MHVHGCHKQFTWWILRHYRCTYCRVSTFGEHWLNACSWLLQTVYLVNSSLMRGIMALSLEMKTCWTSVFVCIRSGFFDKNQCTYSKSQIWLLVPESLQTNCSSHVIAQQADSRNLTGTRETNSNTVRRSFEMPAMNLSSTWGAGLQPVTSCSVNSRKRR